MKENKKAILEILKKSSKKDGKFENLVLNLALQKIDSDSFEFDGDAVYTNDKKRLVYCMSQEASFTIPEGVEIIGEMAFRGKKTLKNVIIANSVKEIEHDAFYDCDELDNVYVPAGVKVVKSYAFAECDKLKKVTFAGTPNKLSRHAFDDCDQLHNIIVPAGSSKFFRKELHFINGDTDYLVLEKAEKKAEAEFGAICKGKADVITNTPDESFAGKMMGDGMMFVPEEGHIYAPCDANVEFVFPTKHAIGLKTKDGVELLLHIGIDTVKMNGEGFDVKVSDGQSVKKGELLMDFDLEKVAREAKSTASVMVFTNLGEDNTIEVVKLGEVKPEELVLKLK